MRGQLALFLCNLSSRFNNRDFDARTRNLPQMTMMMNDDEPLLLLFVMVKRKIVWREVKIRWSGYLRKAGFFFRVGSGRMSLFRAEFFTIRNTKNGPDRMKQRMLVRT